MKKFMVIERVKDGCLDATYDRFKDDFLSVMKSEEYGLKLNLTQAIGSLKRAESQYDEHLNAQIDFATADSLPKDDTEAA